MDELLFVARCGCDPSGICGALDYAVPGMPTLCTLTVTSDELTASCDQLRSSHINARKQRCPCWSILASRRCRF